MAEQDETPEQQSGEQMDRIEAALDRIAARDANRSASPGQAADTTIIAARLDGLITRLREALAIAAG